MNYRGIPYQAFPDDEPGDDGSLVWFIEYQQSPTSGWGFRGQFLEKDGQFFFQDQVFDSAYSVLRYRVTH